MDQQQIKKALGDIVKSTTFSKSQHAKTLLEYLTNATLEGRNIKEFTIADELFHKESDSGVRSYIHNLRKKLIEYYETEGINSELEFSIPTGQYTVKIEPRKPKQIGFYKRWKTLVIYFTLLVFLFVGFLFFQFSKPSNKIENSFIWEKVMNAKEPTLIVIGDNFFYGQDHVTTGNGGVIRDFNINSESELNTYLSSHKHLRDSLYKINWSYMTKQSLYFLFKTLPHMKNMDKIRLVLASELTFDDIKQNNILYFGKYYSTGVLNTVVSDKFYRINSPARELSYFQKDTIFSDKFSIGNLDKDDYPLVLKFITPNNKDILMFLAMDDPGLMATLDYFLDIKNIKFIKNKLKLSNKENNFSALFNVKGYGRTDFSIEYISGEKLDN